MDWKKSRTYLQMMVLIFIYIVNSNIPDGPTDSQQDISGSRKQNWGPKAKAHHQSDGLLIWQYTVQDLFFQHREGVISKGQQI